MLANKNIILGITGGISVYKVADLASKLTQAGTRVDVMMTESATKFIAPLTLSALTHRPVITSLWEFSPEVKISHIALAEAADAIAQADTTITDLEDKGYTNIAAARAELSAAESALESMDYDGAYTRAMDATDMPAAPIVTDTITVTATATRTVTVTGPTDGPTGPTMTDIAIYLGVGLVIGIIIGAAGMWVIKRKPT